MKEIKLSQGKVALVDDEDYEYLNQWRWHVYDNKKRTFYATKTRWICSKIKRGKKVNCNERISMHRLIMKAPKGVQVDHKDGNGLNNQKSNLRLCTPMQNSWNRKKPKGGGTTFIGVQVKKEKRGDRIVARIMVNKRAIFLGKFNTELEAAIAYDNAARQYRGDFAYLNFK